MTVNDYPEFVEGRSLTANELNSLVNYVRHRDTLVARMIGFGINGGLGGTFAGSTLTIDAGLAIDQSGEPLLLATPQTITFAPTLDDDVFPFIDPAPEGYSVVLVGTDIPSAGPACSDPTCAGHSKVHATGVDLRVVAGQVKGTYMDFSQESLLDVEPMRLSVTSNPAGSYVTLRDAIVNRLRNGADPSIVDDALINALAATSIASTDLPGVKGYKCGWINLVLFATLDLLRVLHLLKLQVLREAAPPGVVLGWVTGSGSTWKFDCEYRHAWEPPRGFTEAFLGGTCSDPAGLFRDELEAILSGYAPPDPPPTPPTTGTGGVKPPVTKCPKGMVRVGGKCKYVIEPPVLIPDKWSDYWRYFDPKVPIWYPPDYKQIDRIIDVYELEEINYFDDGIIGLGGGLGYNGADVIAAVKEVIEADGGVANIRTVPAADVGGVSGYLPATGASPSDEIILAVNGAGTVVATGRVPAVHAAKQVSTVVPQAQAAADIAQGAVKEFQAMSVEFENHVEGFSAQLDGFDATLGNLQLEFTTFKGGGFDMSGYGNRLTTLENQSVQLRQMGERVAVLEGRALATVGDLGVKTYTVDVGNTMAEFAQSAVTALRSIEDPRNTRLKEYINEVEIKQGELEIAVRSGDPQMVSGATVELLDSMRTMIGGAGVDAAAKRKLDAQFRSMKDMLG